MDLLKHNYDIVGTALTGVSLLALTIAIGLPWPLWAVYGIIVAVLIGNRIARGQNR